MIRFDSSVLHRGLFFRTLKPNAVTSADGERDHAKEYAPTGGPSPLHWSLIKYMEVSRSIHLIFIPMFNVMFSYFEVLEVLEVDDKK